ncbi:MAG: uroporphyrinogen-III C-methyltransferase [Alphaproteobacteria bacterium]
MEEGSKVYLVGAGPGDPELLTLKALKAIQGADVVVYDRLVSQQILDMIEPGATRIYVGKAASNHHLPQDDINALLVTMARSGHTVVRLKGGDPFIFGRGSEEAEYLSDHGVTFEMVPGVTAASGISAALGIPLTHRGLSTGVRFVTGHARDGVGLDLNWKSLADEQTTLVFYMGLANLPEIAANLMAEGLPACTPAAAISKGTTDGQRQCIGTLSSLPNLVVDLDLPAPVLIVIGRVVGIARTLNWQELPYEDADDIGGALELPEAHERTA